MQCKIKHNGIIAALTLTDEGRLEEGLRTSESLVSDSDDLSVRELVALLKRRGRGSSLHLLLKVQSNVAQLLLKEFELKANIPTCLGHQLESGDGKV